MDSILRGMYRLVCRLRTRAFAVGVLSLVVVYTIYQTTERTHAVYIRDGESLTLAYTIQEEVQEFLEDEGITVMASDMVHFTGFSSPAIAEVEIKRPFSVTLTVGGRRKQLSIHEMTVKQLLDQQGITLDGNDRINMDLSDVLYEGAELVVERIDYSTRTESRQLPYITEQTRSSLLDIGVVRVLVAGEEGEEITTYSQKLKDGEVIFERAIDTQIIREPVTQEELVGAEEAISPLDFGYKFDTDGAPIGYTRVFKHQKATGYSARDGARTASGRYAVPGHVAVNAEKIPYGTKLYIASADGSFIYGYAIAADTGTGLMDGRTDIDLFYDTYTESVLNGVRYVDVYILD
ncbi:MAG: DUF348 domain-containing protein [Provencibacterium sp.]|nr:DUF348 domain-containing protein [Provencibacterium sp.]